MNGEKKAVLVLESSGRRLRAIEGQNDNYILTPNEKRVLILLASDELIAQEMSRLGFIIDTSKISIKEAAKTLLTTLTGCKTTKLAYDSTYCKFYTFRLVGCY